MSMCFLSYIMHKNSYISWDTAKFVCVCVHAFLFQTKTKQRFQSPSVGIEFKHDFVVVNYLNKSCFMRLIRHVSRSVLFQTVST